MPDVFYCFPYPATRKIEPPFFHGNTHTLFQTTLVKACPLRFKGSHTVNNQAAQSIGFSRGSAWAATMSLL